MMVHLYHDLINFLLGYVNTTFKQKVQLHLLATAVHSPGSLPSVTLAIMTQVQWSLHTIVVKLCMLVVC